jgi:diguanylate cyclase (GGDEF)-like protein
MARKNFAFVFLRWRYFNVTRKAIQQCGDGITRHNSRSLAIMSLALVCMVMFFSFYPLVVQKSWCQFLTYAGVGIWELGVFLYAHWIQKYKKFLNVFIYPGLIAFFAGVIFWGIYISTINWLEFQRVNFLVFFICSQLIFVIDPLYNLLLNVITILIFFCFSVLVKPFSVDGTDLINIIIAGITGLAFSWYMSYIFTQKMLAIGRLKSERNRFQEESIRDELTGLGNRRDFMEVVNFFISVCRQVHQSVMVIMLDVDYFKSYNDFYGHPKGDLVLQAIGKELKTITKEEWIYAARVGGEEFIILGTENRLTEAERIALKIKQRIIDLNIPHVKSTVAPYVTASLGVYFMRGGSEDTVEELYSQVDLALYEAKAQGRNRVVLLDSVDKTMRTVVLRPPEQNPGRRKA